MNVNVHIAVRGTGTVRLVRSTIGKTVPVQTAGKQGMKVKNRNSSKRKRFVTIGFNKSKHSINEISEWYELDKDSIKKAIDFEKGMVA